MIAALRRLQSMQEASQLPARIAAFGISGKGRNDWMQWFASHPPLEERIEALRLETR